MGYRLGLKKQFLHEFQYLARGFRLYTVEFDI